MTTFNIPQFLDTEDKVVGPLTAKQLGWIVAACAIFFLIYLFFGKTGLLVLGIPILAIFGGLAFYKPNGRPLTSYASSVISFFTHPKMYMWRRLPDEQISIKRVPPKKSEEILEKKQLTEDRIRDISELLDRRSGINSEK